MRHALLTLPLLGLTALSGITIQPAPARALAPADVIAAADESSCTEARTCSALLTASDYDAPAPNLAVGDRVAATDDRTQLVRDPGRYRLDPYGTFYQIDNKVVEVNRITMKIIRLLGPAADVLK
ncbi:hypothetical protein [Pseudooceanicola algae]|uniref:Excinuclease ABC subunit A n=1 Tax=Pseudooceanicola algae TaxID=1537215 RepID=A0A418SFY4_9RHOB|nr:hypothetical protein [Pseudooceanicola algae]QPM89878.1 hypothetical protein PSAL_011070 [Pseudooceanicola algae]